MGLIQEPAEGQPKHEGGRGDESPGEKEEPQQRSRQPEFPSWQVLFSSPISLPFPGGGKKGGREGRCCSRGWVAGGTPPVRGMSLWGGSLAQALEQNPPQALLKAHKPSASPGRAEGLRTAAKGGFQTEPAPPFPLPRAWEVRVEFWKLGSLGN